MRAARCLAYGPPSSVVVVDVPEPVAAEGQVVVDVAAAAVNFPDVLLVADRYQIHIPVPFTVGSEFAGTVRAVGPGVEAVAVGDRVMGSTLFGAFAEQIAVPARSLQPVDPAVELTTAAASGVAHATAYHALRSVARVQPGEWAVVLGAAGGVGLAAVELGAVLGARMVAAASSPEKTALCLERGAEVAIDYTTEDLKVRVKEITGDGAGVVIDPVGGPQAEQALRAMRWGGRFVTVGFASGEIPRIPLNLVLLKGVIVTGFTMEGFAAHQSGDRARDVAELAALARAGRAAPHISATYPLKETGRALSDLAERRATGKVLVEPGR
jgi:NADPH2:quinone reductase